MQQFFLAIILVLGLGAWWLYGENQTLKENNLKLELAVEEQKEVMSYVSDFCRIFSIPLNAIKDVPFKVIRPISKRPFGNNYCSQLI